MGSGKVFTPRFLGALVNFHKKSFLIQALLLWEKVMTEEKKNGAEKTGGEKEKKIVATYVDASRPPERRTPVPIFLLKKSVAMFPSDCC